MSSFVGLAGHDEIQGSASGDLLIGGTGNDTYVVNHAHDLVIELADSDSDDEDSVWWSTTAAEPITLIRTGPHEFCVRIQIEGAPDGVFAEFRIEDVANGVLGITGLRIDDTDGPMEEVVMADGDSVWEYAFQIGRPNDDGSPTEFEWYGGGHGFEQLQSLGIKLDGVDFSDLPIGVPVNGVSLSVDQNMQIMLPSDGKTVAGAVVLQHVFDSTGLTVNHAHDYLDGFEIGRAYSAMLPVSGAGDGGIDYMQVGNGPAHEIHYDGATYMEVGTPAFATAWGADHNFLLTMSLPSGGPDLNGDWSRAEEWGMWLYDTAVEYSKIYVNWVEGGVGTPAVDSAHQTHYSISLRDAGLAPAAPAAPHAPRGPSQGVDTILASISLTLPDNVEILRMTGSDDLSGFGNRLNNTIIGNAGDNLLDGGGGEDLLYGGAGDDTYLVRTRKDHVEEKAGEGTDTILSMLSSYTLAKNLENLTFLGREAFTGVGNAAANRIEGGEGGDTLRGLDGDDELVGAAGDDTLVGGEGADRLVGGAGVNILLGDAGDDVIDTRGGTGVAQGGTGNDIYYVDDRSISVFEAADEGFDELRTHSAVFVLSANIEALTYTGDQAFLGIGNAVGNRITGGQAGDQLNGGGGADHLSGLGGNDLLMGGDGDDILVGGSGVDSLQGETGSDTVSYDGAAGAVDVRLHLGSTRNDGDGGTDTLVGIENVIGSAFDDFITGEAGDNILRGGGGADTLIGFAGNDVLWGGAGALNTLQGGVGDDYYVIEAADSVIEFAGEGVDTVEARINTYVLAANVENLIFGGTGDFAGTGNGLANVITGGAGNDTLRGGAGSDTLNGGAGQDTVDYTLAAAGVTARLDRQQATNDGDGSTDTFTSVEHLIGSNFNDLLIGDGGDNVLMGGIGTDTLLGFGGNDILWGGAHGGNNQLQGGDGDDYYVLEAFDTVVEFENEGIDTVEARLSSYVMRPNIENLIFNGQTSFTAYGNELDNHITGGAKSDYLHGGGGNDVIDGGLGIDELVLRGLSQDYVVTAEGDGWRIDDKVAGRDGSTLVKSVEILRFANNFSLTLGQSHAVPGPASDGKGAGPQVLPDVGDDGEAFVLPALPDDAMQAPPAFDDVEVPQALADRLFVGLQRHLALHDEGLFGLSHDGSVVMRDGHDWMN